MNHIRTKNVSDTRYVIIDDCDLISSTLAYVVFNNIFNFHARGFVQSILMSLISLIFMAEYLT